ncbi:hypothetical protein [Microvirga guangxiensis]|uniref:hypothetical protein n=1 Tax=Microvirga guangxiensis TaxID=549386 RepID=UPI000B89F34E|nr:hypothetical protein [Microvirga guangxiensis]
MARLERVSIESAGEWPTFKPCAVPLVLGAAAGAPQGREPRWQGAVAGLYVIDGLDHPFQAHRPHVQQNVVVFVGGLSYPPHSVAEDCVAVVVAIVAHVHLKAWVRESYIGVGANTTPLSRDSCIFLEDRPTMT